MDEEIKKQFNAHSSRMDILQKNDTIASFVNFATTIALVLLIIFKTRGIS